MGPVELLVIEFRSNRFKGEIIPALRNAVDRGLIHIIDLVFVKKDRYGDVSIFEISDMENEIAEQFAQITEISGMLSQDDITKIATEIRKNTSVGMLLMEYLWAIQLRDAIMDAKGRVVMDTLITPKLAEKALATAGIEYF